MNRETHAVKEVKCGKIELYIATRNVLEQTCNKGDVVEVKTSKCDVVEGSNVVQANCSTLDVDRCSRSELYQSVMW